MRRVIAGEVLRVRETSPDEAETSFRELDDVFLQTQTRIWLGEVLHERFDEEMAVADLLADGELLFQVSRAIWKIILKKNVDVRHTKFFIYERTSFGKADGRYMAYPKVDSFLKICQILGMTSIDLFSPSDVVEKRDTRRVCMCIRSLSKKARLKNLNIPDFDIVTYTIAMPTGLVGGLRRSLELSRHNSSNSNLSGPPMCPRGLHKQKNFSGSFVRYHDSFSESDEGESTNSEFEFRSPSSNASSPNMSSLIGESSPEDDNILDKNLADLEARFQLDYWYQNENDLHWKNCGSNLSGDIDCGCDANLENAEKEYEPFGCLSHQAQTIKWNPGDNDNEKSKVSDLPQQSSNDGTFYMLETHQRCNKSHKLSNAGFVNVSLEEVRERKQTGNPNLSTILTSDYSANRNTSTDNYVDLMTGKSGANFLDVENDHIALPDTTVSSSRPYLGMKTRDLKLRGIKHRLEGDVIDEAMHYEFSSPSCLIAHTSKTINIPCADNDVYSCETEDCNDILENSAVKHSACVIEGETNCFPFHGMDIIEGSSDLFAPLGRIKPSAEYHTNTDADVFTLETDQSHSCMDGDAVVSSEHLSSSENKADILLAICENAPAPCGSRSSDGIPDANSVVHKGQCASGGGLFEDADKRVAPGIGSDDLEPHEMCVMKESCVCREVYSNSTSSSEAKSEGTSQGWLSEPVACPDSVIDSCHAKIEAYMGYSTLLSAWETEVNAEQNIVDTNQPPPLDNIEDNTRHNLDAAAFVSSKGIEDCEKEVLRMHELNGKNTSRESLKPGNIVLKSVAGGITLVGAAFLFLHFRGRRGKGKVNGGLVPPKKAPKFGQEGSRYKGEDDDDDDAKEAAPNLAQKPSKTQEETNHRGSTQKQAETGGPKVFYPGDKLKLQ